MEHCPNCGGQMKIIGAILEQPVIEKILMHLGLQARAPPRAPARGGAATSGLTVAFPRQSGGPDAGAAEIGCVWALQGRGLRPRRPGKPEGKRYERHPLGLRSVFNGLVPRATTTWVRVRELGGGCSGEEKGRLKGLSSLSGRYSACCLGAA